MGIPGLIFDAGGQFSTLCDCGSGVGGLGVGLEGGEGGGRWEYLFALKVVC